VRGYAGSAAVRSDTAMSFVISYIDNAGHIDLDARSLEWCVTEHGGVDFAITQPPSPPRALRLSHPQPRVGGTCVSPP